MKRLTSTFLAKEYEVTVFATDVYSAGESDPRSLFYLAACHIFWPKSDIIRPLPDLK